MLPHIQDFCLLRHRREEAAQTARTSARPIPQAEQSGLIQHARILPVCCSAASNLWRTALQNLLQGRQRLHSEYHRQHMRATIDGNQRRIQQQGQPLANIQWENLVL